MKMKKIALASITALLLLNACKQKENKETTQTQQTESTPSKPTTADNTLKSATFDINKIKITDDIEGSFPYFKLPEGYTFTDPNSYYGSGKIKDFDKEFLYNHGIYFPIEGKSFKANIRVDGKFKDKVFSKLELQKSFDDLITKLGGVKINNGEPIKSGEEERLLTVAPNALSDGYLFSCNNFEDVHTYVIRTNEKSVFIQYNLSTEEANLTVIEPQAFENKMDIIPATEIQKQLDEKGKAILYINFDTDKSTLKDDGIKAVAEIAKVLEAEKNLKLSIEGHTDNTGEAKHNKTLSYDRANTVLKNLVSLKIDGNRLKSVGYGADKPLVANDTEENKAKNRRVELVKM